MENLFEKLGDILRPEQTPVAYKRLTSQSRFGIEYIFAYPDPAGIDTYEGLLSWEAHDEPNRMLIVSGSKEEAEQSLNIFKS